MPRASTYVDEPEPAVTTDDEPVDLGCPMCGGPMLGSTSGACGFCTARHEKQSSQSWYVQ